MISTAEPVADKISLASESKSLLVLEEWINKLCDLYQISVEQYGNVLIAITEAVNNAIIHGNKNVANKKTDIEYNIENQTITFTVFDEGNGFDFNDLPSDVKITFTINPFIVEVDVVSYLRQNLGDLPIAERKLNPQVPVVRAFMHFP